MADGKYGVEIEGLRELRRDLSAVDRDAGREVQGAIKGAVDRVAQEAASTAPRRTGALAASYRAFTRGNVAGVRSRLVYAPVLEYGGTIKPRGAPITFPRRLIVTKAAEREADRVAGEIANEFERIADRHGWR